jgi:hypothetical protein
VLYWIVGCKAQMDSLNMKYDKVYDGKIGRIYERLRSLENMEKRPRTKEEKEAKK